MTSTKTCTRCGKIKPLNGFHKKAGGRDGLKSVCKECCKLQGAAYYAANRKKVLAKTTEWHKANPAKSKVYSAVYRARHPEKSEAATARWKVANLEKHKTTRAKWQRVNSSKCTAATAAREARKLQATPAWNSEFDDLVFAEAYSLAKAREKATGVKWHVDHIVPLRSKLVCGLHTPSNIQVIPATDNIKKGNRYWPDMPAQGATR